MNIPKGSLGKGSYSDALAKFLPDQCNRVPTTGDMQLPTHTSHIASCRICTNLSIERSFVLLNIHSGCSFTCEESKMAAIIKAHRFHDVACFLTVVRSGYALPRRVVSRRKT